MSAWKRTSWQSKPTLQQANYPSQEALEKAVAELSQLPPLVTSPEIEALKSQIAEAAEGKRFILQGGDCAENFAECNADSIKCKLGILLQMSLILLQGMKKPVTRIGRIAGQYAKPRSADLETKDDITLPSYRGDIVNLPEFSEAARIPNPELLLKGYGHAAMTQNYIRALADGGFADLKHPEYWDLDFVQHSPLAKQYQAITQSIGDALEFVESINGVSERSVSRVDFYTSHEALHLHYEQALTREGITGKLYDFSTHFPWIGMRTADPKGGHVEYFSGIANPVGVKVGPTATAEWLTELINRLNPDNEPGRLTLITRFGADKIAKLLPPLIKAVQKTGKTVLWTCDPMHGNTHSTEDGIKTRSFDNILSELQQAFQIHKDTGSVLGGVHFELTGENVTECIGGARGLSEKDLKRAYKSLVDPRLNYEQALEMAMLIAGN